MLEGSSISSLAWITSRLASNRAIAEEPLPMKACFDPPGGCRLSPSVLALEFTRGYGCPGFVVLGGEILPSLFVLLLSAVFRLLRIRFSGSGRGICVDGTRALRRVTPLLGDGRSVGRSSAPAGGFSDSSRIAAQNGCLGRKQFPPRLRICRPSWRDKTRGAHKKGASLRPGSTCSGRLRHFACWKARPGDGSGSQRFLASCCFWHHHQPPQPPH